MQAGLKKTLVSVMMNCFNGEKYRYEELGIKRLNHLPNFSVKQKRSARRHDQELTSGNGVPPISQSYDEVTPHIYVVHLGQSVDRQLLRKRLEKNGIQTGIQYQNSHQLMCNYDSGNVNLPIAESLYPMLLSLPLHPDLNDKDVVRVCSELSKECAK